MSADINVNRLRDKIDLLERANNQQAETINRYSRKNAALEREVGALRAIVGKAGNNATSGPEIKREGR